MCVMNFYIIDVSKSVYLKGTAICLFLSFFVELLLLPLISIRGTGC